MTLTDTGPLVAIADARDPYHAIAVPAAAALPPGPMLTTWSCLTESMHFLGKSAGAAGQATLWRAVRSGRVRVRDATPAEVVRMEALMALSANVPMDLADASIVAAAEVLGLDRVFSFDGDFRIYQLADGSYLDLIP